MSDIDARIRELMEKEIKSKTLLVNPEDLEKVKKEYLDDGWTLVSTVEVNGRIKVTFTKVK